MRYGVVAGFYGPARFCTDSRKAFSRVACAFIWWSAGAGRFAAMVNPRCKRQDLADCRGVFLAASFCAAVA